MKPIRKAVFPVAGLGTRFLPATKAIPKEMLPVVDRPVLQYAVDEARAAGIEEFIFVSSRGKTVLEDHFDRHFELYDLLEKRGKTDALAEAQSSDLPVAAVTVVRQPEPQGLGHAVWCARHVVGDEPFAVLLPDDVFMSDPPVLKQMVDAYNDVGGSVVGVVDVPREHTVRYGILDVESDDGRMASVRGMVEKPKPEDAPSTLSIVGRYILQPQVFDFLDRGVKGAGNEIQLTDAMASLIGVQPFHGLRYGGQRFDCGDKAGFVAANVAFALARDDLGPKVRALLKGVL
ncbi:MAG: UTP--glucose-1-phosphate uridylyltransferase GalU [Inquilinaceae bacterium]